MTPSTIKLCECGCGSPAPISTQTARSRGLVKGQPRRFIRGHQRRGVKHTAEARRAMVRTRGIHGHARKGNESPTYRSWKSMVSRCTHLSNASWKHYGGRGITVCERWRDFANFLADMGERPEDRTLDRINPNGHYEPGNCRWATAIEQRANRAA